MLLHGQGAVLAAQPPCLTPCRHAHPLTPPLCPPLSPFHPPRRWCRSQLDGGPQGQVAGRGGAVLPAQAPHPHVERAQQGRQRDTVRQAAGGALIGCQLDGAHSQQQAQQPRCTAPVVGWPLWGFVAKHLWLC